MRTGSRPDRFACLLTFAVTTALGVLGCTVAPSRLPPPAPEPSAWEESRSVWGLDLRVVVRHPDEALARTAIREAFEAADASAAKLLASRPGSEIDLIGKVPSRLWIEVSSETYAALTLGARIAEETDGAYDYTWPALLGVWGLREGGTPHVPRAFEIDMALRRVDWEDVELRDEGGLQARRLNRRTELDLGGLARGAIADAACARLRELGVDAARASTASEHAFFGGTDAYPWRVGLAVAVAFLQDGAIAVVKREVAIETTEGQTIYRRFDPRSGRPATESELTAVRATNAAEAAGYAAAAFAMGDEAPAWIESRADLSAIIASDDETIWISPTLAATSRTTP